MTRHRVRVTLAGLAGLVFLAGLGALTAKDPREGTSAPRASRPADAGETSAPVLPGAAAPSIGATPGASSPTQTPAASGPAGPVPTGEPDPATVTIAVGPPPALPGREYPLAPYAAPRHLLADPQGPLMSAYRQPWRGYVQTRAAVDLLAGIGLNYQLLPTGTDDDAVIRLLAAAGVRHLRIEAPFALLRLDGTLDPAGQAHLDTVLAACRRYGVRPMLLLNGHSGRPGPSTAQVIRLRTDAGRGARLLAVESVRGLVPGRSGLSDLTGYWMAEGLFTKVDTVGRTVRLARPLRTPLKAGRDLRVDTLRYAPLHPPGSAEFEDSVQGWLRYAGLVVDRAAAAGIRGFDVEIWNELTFGSAWLSVNNYADPPIADFRGRDPLLPGGVAWELARRTTDLVRARAAGARVIWGFSSTTFLHTPSQSLPPFTAGESYHPYGTGAFSLARPASTQRWERGYVPTLRRVMPEGGAHLGTTEEQLPRAKLAPAVRQRHRPPGTNRFLHVISEHGLVPRELGVDDEAAAQRLKTTMLLRAYGFWLNKGIDVVDLFTAYDARPGGFGLLGVGRPTQLSPSLAALARFTGPLRAAQPIARPTQLRLGASSFGPQPTLYPGVALREQLALLPFQVSARRFLIGSYVMSWDITRPPAPMSFRVRIGALPFPRAAVSLVDPATGRSVRVAAYRDASGLVVDLRLDQSFRWLVIDAA